MKNDIMINGGVPWSYGNAHGATVRFFLQTLQAAQRFLSTMGIGTNIAMTNGLRLLNDSRGGKISPFSYGNI